MAVQEFEIFLDRPPYHECIANLQHNLYPLQSNRMAVMFHQLIDAKPALPN